jgi:putative DNA primase/helicase
MEQMQNATDLSILTAAQLNAANLPPRSDLLTPWLASDTAALVYGPPGIGKSFLALGIAWAVAQGGNQGGSFLGWRAPKPRRVLYVDGEMGAAELRDRLALFGKLPDNLSIVPHDRAGGARLDLGEEDGIVRLMAGWNDPQLLVLDTLSALTPSACAGRDPERRDGLQSFLLHLKQSRRAVLMVDHANKRGALNGTAQRAHAADLVMALRPPEAGAVGGNARFEIHFEKSRQRVSSFPIVAELETVDGAGVWRWDAACRVDRLAALVRQGLSRSDVCETLGIERSWFFRLKAEARMRGLLPPKGTS